MREVITRTLRGMTQEGHPYRGFLYAGLMIAPDGSPRVLEFNCRLGDPEAQVLLMRLRCDLVEPLEAARRPPGRARAGLGSTSGPQGGAGHPGLSGQLPQRRRDHGPLGPRRPDTRIFHAGTVADGGTVVTAGGRVVCVCALGATVGEAQWSAYDRVSQVQFEGMVYRRDIGYRALARVCARS